MRLLHWILGALDLLPNPKLEETIRRLERDARVDREMASRCLDERDAERDIVDAYRHACGVPMGKFPKPKEAVAAHVMSEINEAISRALAVRVVADPKEALDDATK